MARIRVIETADAAGLAGHDAIIDVRSPAEFALDHVPGAINLPVLSNAERARIGTIYVQESRLKANRLGAALVARNIATHLETALADQPATFSPLIYCWRGGQRSESMATILSRIGWRTSILAGGYRTYRREVQARLYDQPCDLNIVLLDGNTGSAKTAILHRLAGLGVQTLDLEGLARHRGSLFGGFADRPQPAQKQFETDLLCALDRLDPSRPVVVEAESSKIGERMIPPGLWQAMARAPRIELSVPRAVRAAYLVSAYSDIIARPEGLEAIFKRLPVYPAQSRRQDWMGLAEAGDYTALAEALIELHYDPAYARGRKKDDRPTHLVVNLPALDAPSQDAAAHQIAARVQLLPRA